MGIYGDGLVIYTAFFEEKRQLVRDDGVSYGDYVEQFTYLLFLKLADEQTHPPLNKPATVPARVSYAELIEREHVNLDLLWLKEDGFADTADLPSPGVLVAEIAASFGLLSPQNALKEYRRRYTGRFNSYIGAAIGGFLRKIPSKYKGY